MSLQQITEDYLIDMDEHGNEVYLAMRAAELAWIERTGFQHYQYNTGRTKRTHLLIATHTDLPDFTEMLRTRVAYDEWVKEEARKQGKPASIGDRSTSPPVWITEAGKFSIDQILPDNIERMLSVTFRKRAAFRATVLTQQDVLLLFQQWIAHAEKRINSCERHQKKTLKEEAETRLSSLVKEMEDAMNIYRSYPTASARIYTGTAKCFYFKTLTHSFPETIPHVGLVLGTETTRATDAKIKRNRPTKLQHIITIGRIGFFHQP